MIRLSFVYIIIILFIVAACSSKKSVHSADGTFYIDEDNNIEQQESISFDSYEAVEDESGFEDTGSLEDSNEEDEQFFIDGDISDADEPLLIDEDISDGDKLSYLDEDNTNPGDEDIPSNEDDFLSVDEYADDYGQNTDAFTDLDEAIIDYDSRDEDIDSDADSLIIFVDEDESDDSPLNDEATDILIIDQDESPDADQDMPGDGCDGAISVTGVNFFYEGNTLSGKNSFSASCGSGDGPDQVFRLNINELSYVEAELFSPVEFDTVLHLKHHDCISDDIACNDDTQFYQQSFIAQSLEKGAYFLIADGRKVEDKGLYELRVRVSPDLCLAVDCGVHGVCANDHNISISCKCDAGYYSDGDKTAPRCVHYTEIPGRTCEGTIDIVSDASGIFSYHGPADPKNPKLTVFKMVLDRETYILPEYDIYEWDLSFIYQKCTLSESWGSEENGFYSWLYPAGTYYIFMRKETDSTAVSFDFKLTFYDDPCDKVTCGGGGECRQFEYGSGETEQYEPSTALYYCSCPAGKVYNEDAGAPTCVAPKDVPGDTCEDPIEIVLDADGSFSHLGMMQGKQDDHVPSCSSGYSEGPDTAYHLVLTEPRYVSMTVRSEMDSPYITIRSSSCNGTAAFCGRYDGSIMLPAGEYFIILDFYDGAEPYLFKMETSPDLCASVDCGGHGTCRMDGIASPTCSCQNGYVLKFDSNTPTCVSSGEQGFSCSSAIEVEFTNNHFAYEQAFILPNLSVSTGCYNYYSNSNPSIFHLNLEETKTIKITAENSGYIFLGDSCPITSPYFCNAGPLVQKTLPAGEYTIIVSSGVYYSEYVPHIVTIDIIDDPCDGVDCGTMGVCIPSLKGGVHCLCDQGFADNRDPDAPTCVPSSQIKGESCANPFEAILDTTGQYKASGSFDRFGDDIQPICGGSANGKDVVYHLSIDKPSFVDIYSNLSAAPPTVIQTMSIRSNCEDMYDLYCSFSSSGVGTNDIYLQPGDYYIILDGTGLGGGEQYSFSVNATPDHCLDIDCGQHGRCLYGYSYGYCSCDDGYVLDTSAIYKRCIPDSKGHGDTCEDPITLKLEGTAAVSVSQEQWFFGDQYDTKCSYWKSPDIVYTFTLTERSYVYISSSSAQNFSLRNDCNSMSDLYCGDSFEGALDAGVYYLILESDGSSYIPGAYTLTIDPENDVCGQVSCGYHGACKQKKATYNDQSLFSCVCDKGYVYNLDPLAPDCIDDPIYDSNSCAAPHEIKFGTNGNYSLTDTLDTRADSRGPTAGSPNGKGEAVYHLNLKDAVFLQMRLNGTTDSLTGYLTTGCDEDAFATDSYGSIDRYFAPGDYYLFVEGRYLASTAPYSISITRYPDLCAGKDCGPHGDCIMSYSSSTTCQCDPGYFYFYNSGSQTCLNPCDGVTCTGATTGCVATAYNAYTCACESGAVYSYDVNDSHCYPVDAVPGDTCTTAIPVVFNASDSYSHTAAMQNKHDDFTASCYSYYKGGDAVYKLHLTKTKYIRVTSSTSFSSALMLRNDCGGTDMQCTSGYSPLEGLLTPGDYYIILDSHSATNTGNYTLAVKQFDDPCSGHETCGGHGACVTEKETSVHCDCSSGFVFNYSQTDPLCIDEATAAGNSCKNPFEVTFNAQKTFTHSASTAYLTDHLSATCDMAENSPEAIYHFSLPSRKFLSASSSASFTRTLFMRSSCDEFSDVVCMGSSFSRFFEAGDYYIGLEGVSGASGVYTFTLSYGEDLCAANPCTAHGTCQQTGTASYSCTCETGYKLINNTAGQTCEKIPDPLPGSSCTTAIPVDMSGANTSFEATRTGNTARYYRIQWDQPALFYAALSTKSTDSSVYDNLLFTDNCDPVGTQLSTNGNFKYTTAAKWILPGTYYLIVDTYKNYGSGSTYAYNGDSLLTIMKSYDDPCTAVSCGAHGTCKTVSPESFSCACDTGYMDNLDTNDRKCVPSADLSGDTCAEPVNVIFDYAGSFTYNADPTAKTSNTTLSCASTTYNAYPDIIYKFTLTAPAYMDIRTGNGSSSRYMALRTSCSDTDAVCTSASEISQMLSSGTYYLIVKSNAVYSLFIRRYDQNPCDGVSCGQGTCVVQEQNRAYCSCNTGYVFNLNYDSPACLPVVNVPGSTCSTPFEVVFPSSGASFLDNSTTLGARNQYTPSCGSGTTPERVYHFFLSESRYVSAAITGQKGFDGVVSLKSTCDSATTILCNTSKIEKLLVPGDYYVVVDGYNAADSGDYSLEIKSLPSPCAGFDCAGHGTCAASSATSSYCSCLSGWYAVGSPRAPTCISPCTGVVCGGSSTGCAPTSSTAFKCNCSSGYYYNNDPAVPACTSPCLTADCGPNGTSCIATSLTAYSCGCKTGYKWDGDACVAYPWEGENCTVPYELAFNGDGIAAFSGSTAKSLNSDTFSCGSSGVSYYSKTHRFELTQKSLVSITADYSSSFFLDLEKDCATSWVCKYYSNKYPETYYYLDPGDYFIKFAGGSSKGAYSLSVKSYGDPCAANDCGGHGTCVADTPATMHCVCNSRFLPLGPNTSPTCVSEQDEPGNSCKEATDVNFKDDGTFRQVINTTDLSDLYYSFTSFYSRKEAVFKVVLTQRSMIQIGYSGTITGTSDNVYIRTDCEAYSELAYFPYTPEFIVLDPGTYYLIKEVYSSPADIFLVKRPDPCSGITCGNGSCSIDRLGDPYCKCNSGYSYDREAQECRSENTVSGASCANPIDVTFDANGSWSRTAVGAGNNDGVPGGCTSASATVYRVTLNIPAYITTGLSLRVSGSHKMTFTSKCGDTCGTNIVSSSKELAAGTYFLVVDALPGYETLPYTVSLSKKTPCTSVSCGSHQHCVNGSSSGACICDDGYVDIDPSSTVVNCADLRSEPGNSCQSARNIVPDGAGNFSFTLQLPFLYETFSASCISNYKDNIFKITLLERSLVTLPGGTAISSSCSPSDEIVCSSYSQIKTLLQAGTYFISYSYYDSSGTITFSGSIKPDPCQSISCGEHQICDINTLGCVCEPGSYNIGTPAIPNCVNPCESVVCADSSGCVAASATDFYCACAGDIYYSNDSLNPACESRTTQAKLDTAGPVYVGKYLLLSNEQTSASIYQTSGTFSMQPGAIDTVSPNNSIDLKRYHTKVNVQSGIGADDLISSNPDAGAIPGDTFLFWTYHVTGETTYYATPTQINATLRVIGSHCRVWTENTGLLSDDDTADLADSCDASYAYLTGAFGDVPDLDGDGMIDVLFLDIADNFEYGYSSSAAGYFNQNDLYNAEYSNHREIIYIDTWPLMRYYRDAAPVPSKAFGSIAHEIMHLINFNRNVLVENLGDPQGVGLTIWIEEGLGLMAEHLTTGALAGLIDYFNHGSDSRGSVYSATAERYLFFSYFLTQAGGDTAIFRSIIENSAEDYLSVESAAKVYIDGSKSYADLLINYQVATLLNEPTGPYGFKGAEDFAAVKRPVLSTSCSSLYIYGGACVICSMDHQAVKLTAGGSSIKTIGIVPSN